MFRNLSDADVGAIVAEPVANIIGAASVDHWGSFLDLVLTFSDRAWRMAAQRVNAWVLPVVIALFATKKRLGLSAKNAWIITAWLALGATVGGIMRTLLSELLTSTAPIGRAIVSATF